MDEELYSTISKMLADGASLDQIEDRLEGTTADLTEEQRSALWLRRHYEWERRGSAARNRLESSRPRLLD